MRYWVDLKKASGCMMNWRYWVGSWRLREWRVVMKIWNGVWRGRVCCLREARVVLMVCLRFGRVERKYPMMASHRSSMRVA